MRFTPIIRAISVSGRRIPLPKDLSLRIPTENGIEEVIIQAATGNPTGITTIFEHPNPRPALIKVYDSTLKLLESKYPTSSVYRQSVENLTKARKQIVQENTTNEIIESKIGSGIIEEILIQAADEYILAEKLAEHRPWEELANKPPADQWIK